jgi:thioredoxin 1
MNSDREYRLPTMEETMSKRVSKDDFDSEVLQSSLPVLVDFYSDSCVPCKRLSPVIGDIEDDNEGKLVVVKVNTNFDGELAEQYNVMAVPTLILFNGGNEVARRTGADKKEVIAGWIDESLKN